MREGAFFLLWDAETACPPPPSSPSQVVSFLNDARYASFTRIVFDTAPTGHTLRLLSLPDFLDKSIGKIVRLRQKLASATDAIKGLFGAEATQDEAVKKLEALKVGRKEGGGGMRPFFVCEGRVLKGGE